MRYLKSLWHHKIIFQEHKQNIAFIHANWATYCLLWSLQNSQKPTSSDPPWIFLIPIMSMGRRSSRQLTASTTMLAKKSFWLATSLELRVVAAHFLSRLLCSLEKKWQIEFDGHFRIWKSSRKTLEELDMKFSQMSATC